MQAFLVVTLLALSLVSSLAASLEHITTARPHVLAARSALPISRPDGSEAHNTLEMIATSATTVNLDDRVQLKVNEATSLLLHL